MKIKSLLLTKSALIRLRASLFVKDHQILIVIKRLLLAERQSAHHQSPRSDCSWNQRGKRPTHEAQAGRYLDSHGDDARSGPDQVHGRVVAVLVADDDLLRVIGLVPEELVDGHRAPDDLAEAVRAGLVTEIFHQLLDLWRHGQRQAGRLALFVGSWHGLLG